MPRFTGLSVANVADSISADEGKRAMRREADSKSTGESNSAPEPVSAGTSETRTGESPVPNAVPSKRKPGPKPGTGKGIPKGPRGPNGLSPEQRVRGGVSPPRRTWDDLTAELDPLVEDYMLSVIRGDKQLVSGPTGKDIWRRPSEATKQRMLEMYMDRRRAKLSATELTGANGGPIETADVGSTDPRDVARAVLGLFREADVGQGGSVHFTQPNETIVRLPTSLAHVVGGEPAAGPEPAPPARKFEVGEVEAFDNRAYIECQIVPTGRPNLSDPNQIRRFAVFNAHEQLVGYRSRYEDAVQLALAQPGLMGVRP